ncbi:hypothetical protein IWW57_001937 [Coemansia sp. S610]|uniref:Uncharacterized protein n=1 Tax=Coemansia spiralis TaxID=417178 RepID=A0A9W8L441_9FUNG|nr:hypothetical protein LPJ60_006640 [Coemansia sp. RSA 2675]KAJ2018620.1 hypothetical protein GGI06_002691 [Coemansia sp. S85]KAJ2028932.1 hypothetical protein IWW57_001937 [Coemansia sp. S610]KAJ2416957.1 hypothetical protein GGI10_000558 [Coemansia sp. RSA 2530]KAJ2688900.1 hypothetical protein IWW39_001862 [Coemansia spiralis]KAJ2694033.1 hypothetical protein H4218_005789 [Coemansia sp. IMI 209128]
MKLSFAISAFAAAAAATNYMVPISKDAGLVYTNMMCGTTPCGDTNLSNQSTYTAFLGNRDFRRILMSYSLPSDVTDMSTIQSCTLMLPQPVSTSGTGSFYSLSVSPLVGDYDANTVTPRTAPPAGASIAQFSSTDNLMPPSIDVTAACKDAVGGNVGLMLDSYAGPVTFPTKLGGSTAQLMITTM